MKIPLWRLREGPEWKASVEAADPGTPRFKENVDVLREVIEHAPYARCRELHEANLDDRYATTRDVSEGYRLVAFFHVDKQKQTCTLGWLARENLE